MLARGLTGAAMALLIGTLAACSSPEPSLAPRSVPIPPPSAATAAPSPPDLVHVLPEPDCPGSPRITTSDGLRLDITLLCEGAVEAAVGVLPAEHLPVAAIEFGYGTHCPRGCPIPDFNKGYVIFDTVGLYTDLLVQVMANEAGDVAVIEGPSPLLPRDRYVGDVVLEVARHHSLDPSV